ncbi:SixA phosphatase family protein [Flavobacterium caeni]|uniref:Phosphohistidine phosphatase n=1 Tax=Flavobacterium caeni TaxID=490189 RepID=A0A1G5CUV1_9FLAO|nr:histidine phosphatase family protein [Flavobacterium caeni]SCY05980.1 phosphohistidine phosphatase [Flavobacterium caeni]
MKNLILIRHAKSSWEAPLSDIDRPLDARGIQDAHLVSMNCQIHLPKTFTIWSSVATRAKETALIFAQNISYPVENINFRDSLYTFDERELERNVHAFDDHYDNVILFGHNEAITNFVNKFGDIYIDNVPTSGFVSIKFDTENWASVANGRTHATLFPRQLKESKQT